MAQKITKQEFKKWSQQLQQILKEFVGNPTTKFTSEEARKKFIQMGVLTYQYVEKGVVVAVFMGMAGLEEAGLIANTPLSALDNLTFLEWEQKVLNRLKEHCIANGYYKPNSPPDLALLKERRKKAAKLFSDKGERVKLLAYADSEDYETLSNMWLYIDQAEEIFPSKEEDPGDDIPQIIDFLVEDWVGRAEKLISKKEEAEKKLKKKIPLILLPFPNLLRNIKVI